MKVKDLPTDPAYGILLWCPRCESECSANRADYILWVDKEKHVACTCGEILRLVRKCITYKNMETQS